ncbi:MAG: histone deacetylase, partial [Dehalococcoidia bacterium]
MSNVGYVYDPLYLEHGVEGHAESPARLQAIMSHLEESGLLAQMTAVEARDATVAELERVHWAEAIDRVRGLSAGGGGWLDPDTYVVGRSYDAA